ncbi:MULTISPECIES: recombinase family protein [unclassified Streptomyces]|uniref:recombinase family protein n=1 Tax=unclassified Streptomyces TaxID=2593676 RepID=UPI00081E0C69|nr:MULTISPECIES: recombinase family protein [unclassified Streptomyces]SCF96944.1 Site-specific DNA recombinase [Streptomyces sp. MnatMP-M17]
MTPTQTAPEWTAEELAELAELNARNDALPEDAPRGLLSVRLSILTEDTTSPARQELDLRRHAIREGVRVVGVARDLGVSATKKAPWERKELGDWLNNRIPEFDLILFWKLDRFIRRISDLHEVIKWCEKFGKNLVSLNDTLDLSSPMAQAMVTFVAAVAEIEAANTKTRVSSHWEYTKQQDQWRIGKPSFGYKTGRVEGKLRLVQDPKQARAVRYMYQAAMRGVPANRIAKVLDRAKVPTYSNRKWNNQQVLRILRNPAVRGLRTEGGTKSTTYKSTPVLDKQGQEIRVTDEPILTNEEFERVQEALATRAKNKRHHEKNRRPTRFLGVMKHECGRNVNETNNYKTLSTGEVKEYRYLRCPECRKPGFVTPDPEHVYSALTEAVFEALGDFEVIRREYARGDENRRERKRLEDGISYYMTGLEPGGRFDKSGFIREKAEATLDALMNDLTKIDPDSTKDRWVYESTGVTYAQHWNTGGVEAMERDLLSAGITFELGKHDNGELVGKLIIPHDVKKRLIRMDNNWS